MHAYIHTYMHIQRRKDGKGQKNKEGKINRKNTYGCVDE
jgi:hypothetical protein